MPNDGTLCQAGTATTHRQNRQHGARIWKLLEQEACDIAHHRLTDVRIMYAR
jgi:hypothetical protein